MSGRFNIIKFCKAFKVKYATSGTQITSGWIGIETCPFCGKTNNGLGFNLSSNAIKCWRCGRHDIISLIKALCECNYNTAKKIQTEYTDTRDRNAAEDKQGAYKATKTTCLYPTGTVPLNDRHKAYLEGRGFDADHLEEIWHLRGTGNLGDYKFRILVPVMFDRVMVSYQGRDYIGKAELRYKTCKQENEVIPHQHLLYGLDFIKNRKCLIVEGIFDVFRMGPGSVCCFGISWLYQQVELIVEYCDTVFILFDNEPNAQKQALSLAVALNARGVDVEVLDISDTTSGMLVDPSGGIDPGNLKQEYADAIMSDLGFN